MFTAMLMCQELKQCKWCLKVYAVTRGADVVFEWKLRAKTDRQINKSYFQEICYLSSVKVLKGF